jgi:hypothetical protein
LIAQTNAAGVMGRVVAPAASVKHDAVRFCLPHCLWLNQVMFARKIRVEYEEHGQRLPCPLKWLDSFSMRNFTNASVFDDTVPVSDGRMEIGTNVPLEQLRDAMEDWFRRKNYLPKDSKLSLEEP